MRIFIIGSGVVGTATGRGFIEAGHRVTFVDVSPQRVEDLTARGLDARARIDLATEEAAYIFLTLPTPNDGTRYDLTAFLEGTRAVGRALREADAVHTVVVRSTVTPGTTEGLVGPVLERESGLRQDEGFLLASNPEFLRAASAVADFRWPRMTVVGARNRRVRERLVELFTPFGGELRVFAEPMTAEFIKCAHNIFNATKISFWNEMHAVAQRAGLDLAEIAETVARSAEASFNPTYGIRGGAPYGGACLPKDTKAFLGFADTLDIDMPLLRAVVEVNDRLVGSPSAVPVPAALVPAAMTGPPRIEIPEQPTGDRVPARAAESPVR
ncbi:NAD(P)-binding domain-containing protein [Pseudofrankia inefficax]|uniref:Nucleotide sugar dehydrogenase n=1 Tax=Pseudofrankia inefficax (strain DSM 45817 / CECT 9037 / DDB 130130 / EuI1c) TaxID=298654 RepID=E3J4S8_PSEI1|nr:NAD(P)-binding domain-containing protein [Pseudofrankia inefficax]ADP78247.1 nucleotide sugar dehydrogenase [Pseudofrankia inefficax]